jgi:hypothetical protein
VLEFLPPAAEVSRISGSTGPTVAGRFGVRPRFETEVSWHEVGFVRSKVSDRSSPQLRGAVVEW